MQKRCARLHRVKLTCGQTLRVLRAQQQLILTIVDVLKHDPLQKWTITKKAQQKAQQDATTTTTLPTGTLSTEVDHDEDAPAEASRALAGVRNKLGNRLPIDHQISQLILEATDPDHLGSIFFGWSVLRVAVSTLTCAGSPTSEWVDRSSPGRADADLVSGKFISSAPIFSRPFPVHV